MKTTNLHYQSVIAALRERSSADVNHRRAQPLRPQLVAEGVVAGYIHDISVRHGRHGVVTPWRADGLAVRSRRRRP